MATPIYRLFLTVVLASTTLSAQQIPPGPGRQSSGFSTFAGAEPALCLHSDDDQRQCFCGQSMGAHWEVLRHRRMGHSRLHYSVRRRRCKLGTVRSIGNEILVGKTQYSYTYTQPVRERAIYNMYHGTLEAIPVTATTSRIRYTLFL